MNRVVSEQAAPLDEAVAGRAGPNQAGMAPLTDLPAFRRDYAARTARSKSQAESCRVKLADKSSIAFGASDLTSGLAYPIVAEYAAGSRLRDIDGNEYVDILQGLGANLFGHNPAFVRDAIEGQIERGFPIGVQTELVAEVADLLVRITGMPRVCFSNTGTEAVMTAIRIARAATKRQKVAVFANSYHGHSDTVLMRPLFIEHVRKRLRDRLGGVPLLGRALRRSLTHGAAPASAGIPSAVARDVIVLDYGDPKSLDVISKQGDRLAAVLVEPVQSRQPELQPRDFLHALRAATAKTGTALVFDEMVTGFRVHPGGAQADFGVDADLATYSKVVGGGLPLSVVAGRGKYMEWIQPVDPASDSRTVFFAGTFCKHPLALAASRAVLIEMLRAGPRLQSNLNERTAGLVSRLNRAAEQIGIAAHFVHYGSFFSVAMTKSRLLPAQVNLLSYYLLSQGAHLRGGDRGGFLTTAHTDSDIDFLVTAFTTGLEAIQELDS